MSSRKSLSEWKPERLRFDHMDYELLRVPQSSAIFTFLPVPFLISDMTLLVTLTASNSATLDDTTHLTSLYDLYQIVWENIVPVTNATDFICRVSTNGGSTYLSASYVFNLGNIGSGVPSAPTDGFYLGSHAGDIGDVPNTAAYGTSGSMYLQAPSSTTVRKWVWGQAVTKGLIVCTYAGYQDGGNTAINAIRFLFSSGNINTGKIRIYGIQTT